MSFNRLLGARDVGEGPGPINNTHLTPGPIPCELGGHAIGMRQISAETVEWFVPACKGGGLTRSALARELCERENWFGGAGRPCLASARKLLPRLAEETGVRLPEAESTALEPHACPASDFPDSSVSCPLRDLGALSLDPVTEAADRRRWEAMVETHHPQGWRRPPGGQVRYWVRSERHGVLGGIGFAASGMQLGPRDAVIGWSSDARVANIGKVVCKSCVPGPPPGDGTDCGRLGGGLRRAPGSGADLHGAGDVRPELPGGGMEVLPGADLGPPFGGAPRGLAEAAG